VGVGLRNRVQRLGVFDVGLRVMSESRGPAGDGLLCFSFLFGVQVRWRRRAGGGAPVFFQAECRSR